MVLLLSAMLVNQRSQVPFPASPEPLLVEQPGVPITKTHKNYKPSRPSTGKATTSCLWSILKTALY